MNLKTVLVLLFILFIHTINAQDNTNKLDRSIFYDILASENIDKIDSLLSGIKGLTLKEKEAYEGALLMKKAGIIQGPRKKLAVFKDGHTLLEQAISEDNTNPEYRFLRLIIQENAPKILGYHHEIETDSQYILEHIQALSPTIQKAVLDYCKKSKVLSEESVRKAML